MIPFPGEPCATEAEAPGGLDAKLVEIIAFAIQRLGPASSRACWQGRPIEIDVPDPATAAALRAALDLTCRQRSTDRLITIVCPAEPAAA
jgi:hypothetical protein